MSPELRDLERRVAACPDDEAARQRLTAARVRAGVGPVHDYPVWPVERGDRIYASCRRSIGWWRANWRARIYEIRIQVPWLEGAALRRHLSKWSRRARGHGSFPYRAWLKEVRIATDTLTPREQAVKAGKPKATVKPDPRQALLFGGEA